jgi:hypothetical protein
MRSQLLVGLLLLRGGSGLLHPRACLARLGAPHWQRTVWRHTVATPTAGPAHNDWAPDEEDDQRVPVTLLSGFLGSGKTSLLQHVLANKEGLRVGVVVNDLAAVNVDAKLVRQGAHFSGDFVELANGCMCCTMADELFGSVAQLVAVNELRHPGRPYDHIVIESSGVSEPRAVRDNFQDGEAMGLSLLDKVRLDTLITVVDSSSFLGAYESSQRVKDRPDLGRTAGASAMAM